MVLKLLSAVCRRQIIFYFYMTKKDKIRYEQAISFLLSLKNIPPISRFKGLSAMDQRKMHKPRLEFLLRLLGNPERGMKYVHVTGTSGKGSVTALIHSILCQAGFKAGCFFSPHITTELERIKVGDSLISPADFASRLEEF
jgi:folylpolyglutamate synthase/dihydropteroate synthase